VRPVVVFDTNILLSALLSPTGAPFRCIAMAKVGIVESITCEEILDEFREKLENKFGYESPRAQAAVEEIRAISRLVAIPNTLTGIIPDPDDHKVLECAVVGGATHIITGDRRHLLPLGSYQGVVIVRAADFLSQMTAS
jgi:putative PIN family toxin of toxin-antitoxin system